MAGEIVINYIADLTGITGTVYEYEGGPLRDGPVATVETPAGSGRYVGDSALIVPNDTIIAEHNGAFLGSETWMADAVLVTTVSDPAPAGGNTTDAVFDIASGLLADDEFFNNVITIQDISSGDRSNRRILSYKIVGGNRRVTVAFPFEFPLSIGDTVIIKVGTYDSFSGPSAEENAIAIWAANRNTNRSSGSMGQVQGIQGWDGR